MELINQFCRVSFQSKGAEVTSFYDLETNQEYVYDEKPKHWAFQNPILFPQIGTYRPFRINGQDYQMNNHGFARNSMFRLKSQTEDSITFSLTENKETLAAYPYLFELEVTYLLVGKKLEIYYRIFNNDQEVMPFAFGLHPAFKISKLENCRVIFKQDIEDPYQLIKDQTMHLKTEDFIKHDTLIFPVGKLESFCLLDTNKRLEVSCKGFNYLAIWTKKDAPFVCIEPWLSQSNVSILDEFSKIKDIINIEPQMCYEIAYSWEILGGKDENRK